MKWADDMKIQVTARDIKNGISDVQFCPVALAVKRATKKMEGVSVFSKPYYSIWIDGKRHEAPKKVERFIDCFDKEQEVEPFSFTIRGLK